MGVSMSEKNKPNNKKHLSLDGDICPLFTAVSDKLETCRIDCAWYDMEQGGCALICINVQLKNMNDSLKHM